MNKTCCEVRAIVDVKIPTPNDDIMYTAAKSSRTKKLPLNGIPNHNNTNAIKIPIIMFKNTSHTIPIPELAATPPNPTIAAVLINVAP